ncbi:MAG: ATP-dependent Clp protease ATP-binding subunit [Candidatus Levybacteria bacterium]|nr:ATP-dependent Clp protease ATP-binding subunit [Candidatus Levybacteria bacterium]
MDRQLVSIYLFYRSIEVKFIRVALPVILLMWIPLVLITNESPNVPIVIFNLYLMGELFYRYKICTLRTKNTLLDQEDPYKSMSLEVASVFQNASSTKEILRRLFSHQQVIFGLQRMGASPRDVVSIEYEANVLLLRASELAKKIQGTKITLIDVLNSYLIVSDEKTNFLLHKRLKENDLLQISVWVRKIYQFEEKPRELFFANYGGGLGQWLVSGWTLETKKYTQVFPQKDLNLDVSIIGREKEYQLLQESLLKPERNNILIVGKTGVGKEQLLRRLAEDSFSGKLDKNLSYKTILEVLVGSLVAGANQQGDLQERLKEIIEEVSHAGNVILYIPEFQNLLGGTSFSLDLSGALMPFLRDGKLPIIASVTDENFKRYIQGKPISEMFSDIHLTAPSSNQAEQMIMEKIVELERKHAVIITYPAVKTSVMFAQKYSDSSELPGSAIDLLSDAMSKKASEDIHDAHNKFRLVTEKDIIHTVEQRTSIALDDPTEEESSRLLHLESIMHERIIGQDQAIKAIAESLRRLRTGVQSLDRPTSFLFLGPTGVGKTEVAKVLSNIYFNGEANMIRLDMSEYASTDGIERLIGASTRQNDLRGELTEKIHDHPNSLVLLDEFEKAHSSVANLFLQILDDGRLTDGRGNTVSFSNAIIIATSNAGANFIHDAIEKNVFLDSSFQKQLRSFLQANNIFKPELLNRFDDIVVFRPLLKDDVRKVTEILLRDLISHMKEKDITLSVEDIAVSKIISEGYDKEYGARPIRRYIQDNLDDLIAKEILNKSINRGDRVRIGVNQINEFVIYRI